MKKSSQKGTKSIIHEILFGVLAGMIISILLALLVSMFVIKGGLAEDNIKYIVMPIQFIAALTGSVLTGKRVEQKYAIVCGCTAAIYCLILLSITIMFFESAFQTVGLGIGMCTAGYIASCIMCMMKKGNKRRRKP